jgi:hypothetical protein
MGASPLNSGAGVVRMKVGLQGFERGNFEQFFEEFRTR